MEVDKGYGGFLWIVDEPERARVFDEYSAMGWVFSDALSGPDWSAKQKEIFLVSLDGSTVHFAALAKKRARSAQLTKKFSIEFTHYVRFEPISIYIIESLLKAKQQKYFARASTGVGVRVPPTAWQQVIASLKNERPDAEDDIDELERLRREGSKQRQAQRDITLAQEKDSLGIMLDIFGLKRKSIVPYLDRDKINEDLSFLSCLDKRPMTEDRMIEWDANLFGEFHSNDLRGYEVFSSGERELRVWNVNREKLETTLGIDMIFYNEQFRSMVLVQYKRMKKTNDEDRWRYYPSSDRNYKKELNRMLVHQKELDLISLKNPLPQIDSRLYKNAFFFKFCEQVSFEETGAELIPGMYVSANYLENYFRLPDAEGPRGGGSVSPVRCRYMTNSLFTDLIKAGWIGTRATDSTLVGNWIRDALAGQRSVMVGQSQIRNAFE